MSEGCENSAAELTDEQLDRASGGIDRDDRYCRCESPDYVYGGNGRRYCRSCGKPEDLCGVRLTVPRG